MRPSSKLESKDVYYLRSGKDYVIHDEYFSVRYLRPATTTVP
jgi:hypothetical protein